MNTTFETIHTYTLKFIALEHSHLSKEIDAHVILTITSGLACDLEGSTLEKNAVRQNNAFRNFTRIVTEPVHAHP
jgi:hypothetical protein